MSQECASILPIALFFFIGQLLSHVVTKMPLFKKSPKTKLFTPKRKFGKKKKKTNKRMGGKLELMAPFDYMKLCSTHVYL